MGLLKTQNSRPYKADTFKGGNVACQSSSTSTTIGLSIPPSSPIVEAQKGLEAALIQSPLYCKRLCLISQENDCRGCVIISDFFPAFLTFDLTHSSPKLAYLTKMISKRLCRPFGPPSLRFRSSNCTQKKSLSFYIG